MFDKNFYPTPDTLVDKMMDLVDTRYIDTILEPSAGKGNIADILTKRLMNKGNRFNDEPYRQKIDTIELNSELQATLKGKGYKVIHDDFLTFNTFKRYDLIIMNPPFDNGDKHLLKAIDIQKRGGEIICILNAETIRNQYSNTRKELINLLQYYDAKIEFLEEQFTNAERTTNVEVALIYINIERNFEDSLIIDSLKNEKKRDNFRFTDKNQIISADPIEAAIQNFELEVEAGLRLIYNYFDLLPLIQDDIQKESNSPILTITMRGKNSYDTRPSIINEYIEEVRYKYWKALINMDRFSQILTSNLKQEMYDKLNELRQYDFTKYNIQEVMNSIMAGMNESLNTTIMGLFDDLTYKYTYNQYSSNIHLYNGWKTNIGYKINDKKVILPLSGYDDMWYGDKVYFGYGVEDKIRDMQKAFEYLEGGKTEGFDNIREILQKAEEENNDLVEFKYFKIKFYKKGTGHIYWKDKELVKKLNIYGGKNKNWLPDNYGTTSYEDMNQEEKNVVNEFEGEKEYQKTLANSKYLLSVPTVDKLMLM